MFNSALLVNLCYLLAILSGIVQGSKDCYCQNDGIGSWVNCEVADQTCLDQVVAPFLQDTLGTVSYDQLSFTCNESAPIVFPKDLIRDATFKSLVVWCGSAIMEPGALGPAEATLTEFATLRLRQIPALQATRLLDLYIYCPSSLIITNDTFTGYHSLQNLRFVETTTVIESIEYGTFTTLPKLELLLFSSLVIIHDLGPGSLHFNPGNLKQIILGQVGHIHPGAIAGIPKGVDLQMISLASSDLSIEIFGGLLYGGSHLRVADPIDHCKCSTAWIVKDTSLSLNSNQVTNVRCNDFSLPYGPRYLYNLTPYEFTDCP